MTQTWTWQAMAPVLEKVDLLAAMEEAFRGYSAGRAVIPPVGELQFASPPGDVHLKYGYLRGGDHYVVKIASGFYDNPKRGLPSSNGLMLLFDQHTGQPVAVLLDEGRLTDARTAAAGAVAARHLGPKRVRSVGIVGAGTQARLQLRALEPVTACRSAVVWARRYYEAERYAAELAEHGWEVTPARNLSDLTRKSTLIVTTTPSTEALLDASMIQPGTHITAVGSDTPSKRELATDLLVRAERVVADSLSQCRERGEVARAMAEGFSDTEVVELGKVIGGHAAGRQSDTDITVADLTGVAVQDLAIAEAVYRALAVSES